MNPATTPLFPDGSSSQQLWFKSIPDEELNTLLNLSSDERGIFTTLRYWSTTNNGLPTDLDELWDEVRYLAGISRYKFRKLVPRVLAKKFQIIGGRFYFGRDEERVEEARGKIRKSRDYGQIGASRRWGKDEFEQKTEKVVPMGTPCPTPMALERKSRESREEDTSVIEDPPPTPSFENNEVGNLARSVSPPRKPPERESRFHEFWDRYKSLRDAGRREASARAWISYSCEEHTTEVFGALDSYERSRDVVNGAVKNGDGWLQTLFESEWTARWPEPVTAKSAYERMMEAI